MPLFGPSGGSGGGGAGTVTSVGLTASGLLHNVSGSPVTTAGTLALTLKTQVAGALLAGPISGADAAPTMRALDPLDVPSLDASKITSGTFAAARIGSVNPSTLTGTGTVPLAALSALTTAQLSASAGLVAGQIASVNPSALTGTGTVPLAALSGITTSQLDAAAAITSAQIAALATSKLTGTISASQLAVSAPTSGQLGGLVTGNLSATAGILGSQLDSAAAIASGQITSLAASKLTGSATLPDSVLSTNVPLLASANTFTAAQTISATVAGVLAQINNASTTGAGLVIGSTTVASAGAGIIAPALALTQAPPATTRYGLLSVGSGAWDGSTTGKFVGSASGTGVAGNFASGYAGNLLDLQVNGTSKVKGDASGNLTANSLTCSASVVGNNNVNTPLLQDTAGTGPSVALSASALTISTRTATNVGLITKGVASQTADLQQWQNSAAAVQFGITNRGSGGSPIWALKVRAVANAESMAQAHTIGAATGKAIEVMDDAGASLGFLAIYA